MGYIYKITNQINGKVYIGLTRTTIEERWKSHLRKAKEYPNRYLYDAMNHYGYDNFTIEQIEECEECLLDDREKYWIAFFNSTDPEKGYNLTIGGGGGNTWQFNPHKLETGEKIRQAQLKEKYIPITQQSLEEDIQNQLSVEQMCNKYSCSPTTLRHRSQEFFGCQISDLRTIPNSGQFVAIEIDKNELYQDIMSGTMTTIKIAEKYGVTDHTIISRCKQYFGKTPTELRGSAAKRAIITDENLLNQLILEGKTLAEIATIFQMSKNSLVARLKETYQMNFKEYRNYVKSKN